MNAEEFGTILGKVDNCIEEFITHKRVGIDSFVQSHFSLQEAWQLQKTSVAWDIVFYPLNTLWSIPYLTIKKTIEIIDKLGWPSFNKTLNYIPSGFKTRFQKQAENLITKEFISVSATENLIQELDKAAGISKVLNPAALTELDYKISALIKKEIDTHTSSQILVTDLVTSGVTLFIGKLIFGDGTLGILGMGNKVAGKFANSRASDNFFLGKSAGSMFYKAFPVAPTKTQIYIATFSIGLLLTVFSLTASVLSDPLRKRLGLHHKKLNSLLDNLEEKIFLLVKSELKRTTAKSSTERCVG